MKRPLYYLLCAIACTSMVSSTMPTAAIAEAIQPQATTEPQAQTGTSNSATGKAKDTANANATADTVEGSAAATVDTSAANTESADVTTAGTTTNATDAITANDNKTATPTPSLRTQAAGTPEAISTAAATPYAHSATATQNGVTFTVSWNDAPAGAATTFHVTQAGGSSQAKARMDVPTYWDGGSQESVCDPSRQAWSGYYSLGTAGHDFTFDFTASGTYRIHFYFMDNDRNDPQNDKGIYYLRTTAEVTVDDAARPSVTQIVNDAVAQCRQETNGSEYDMALWLHDWTLDQLEYDHGLNWCSAESGLTRHQGTCESYQRIYAKLLNAAGIANGRITGNGHTWNAVKIDGKWCQMDLTWDDTSDNWYGDLDQRHLYFGLTDELMAIAHSDHTANYQKDDYAYRSTDLSNNYFVRNGKAEEWDEKYADRIQQHLDAREESFSIDADNQSFPPSISGIQNGIVAYAMNLREWRVPDAKVKLAASSNISKESSYAWCAAYNFTAIYQKSPDIPSVQTRPFDNGVYTITSALDPGMALDVAGGSVEPSANVRLWGSNGTPAQQFRVTHDTETGAYEIACLKSGLALDVQGGTIANCWNVQQYTRNGTAAQRWRIVPNGDGTHTLACAGNDLYALDAAGGGTSWGTNVQIYERNGTAAQSWILTPAATAPSVSDGVYTITSALDPGMALDVAGGSVEPSANVRLWGSNGTPAQQFRVTHDTETGAYEIACLKSGLALDVQGGTIANCWNVQQYTRNGTAAQRWRIVPNGDGTHTLACAGNDLYALDAAGGGTSWGTNVQIYERNGTAAQSWILSKISSS